MALKLLHKQVYQLQACFFLKAMPDHKRKDIVRVLLFCTRVLKEPLY